MFTNICGITDFITPSRLQNCNTSAVKKWEQGKARPMGATLKLLSIVEKKGIEVIAN